MGALAHCLEQVTVHSCNSRRVDDHESRHAGDEPGHERTRNWMARAVHWFNAASSFLVAESLRDTQASGWRLLRACCAHPGERGPSCRAREKRAPPCASRSQDERKKDRTVTSSIFEEITMPRGEKSGNPRMKRHRARRIAERMRRQGVPRGDAYRTATAAMEREYDRVGPRDPEKMAVNEDAHDSLTGQRKTNLTTKRGPAVSGAGKPGVAQRSSSSKRSTKDMGGGGKASAGRKPRTSGDPATQPKARKSAAATRKPPPWRAAGYRPPRAGKKLRANESIATNRASSKRTPRSMGPGGAATARKPALAGRTSTAKKSSGVSRRT
jgi:hypothetical protein